MIRPELDKLDCQIIKLISDDARIPFLEVARECGVSGAAIHQRIQKLTHLGVLKGTRYIIDPEKTGFDLCAFIGLKLNRAESADEVVDNIKSVPEVVECHYTTGAYDFLVKVYATDRLHLLAIIHDKLQPLGLTCSDSVISLCTPIDRQLPVLDMPPAKEEQK
ncbi:MAG: Lrp/AsnC family transcriptional regulator [Bacteroidales bacterium]|nr:Lrp/AsnC family transcriptional regulator [Bacteroidales bacterium]